MTTASGHTSAIRAKKVIGTTVKNTAGEKIGQVEDIVLDKTSNSIVFAVVGFGGYPAFPSLLAASSRRIPTILHEQNAVLGRVNRLLAGEAEAIGTAY